MTVDLWGEVGVHALLETTAGAELAVARETGAVLEVIAGPVGA